MPCCLCYCRVASQLDPKRVKRVIAFWFSAQLRISIGFTLDSGLAPARGNKKKTSEIPPTAPIPPQNHGTGLSAPFQLNSKPNLSPQRTLQSSESKKASHPDSEIMLLGPAMDIFEARAECRAYKLTLTRERERRVLAMLLSAGSSRTLRFICQTQRKAHSFHRPIKIKLSLTNKARGQPESILCQTEQTSYRICFS